MKRHRLPAWSLILAGLLLAAPGPVAAPPETISLVRIGGPAAAALPSSLRADLKAVAALRSSWLLALPESGLRRLTLAGCGFEVLDADTAGQAYFLVRIRGQADWAALQGVGRSVRLEEGTALFWSGGREAREVLPSGMRFGRLFLDTALPLEPGLDPARARRDEAGDDPQIAALVSQVSKSRLTQAISDLEGFRTRYAITPGCESAGAYLYDELAKLGLDVAYDPFVFAGTRSSRNVVATLPGTLFPDRQVIVCGHYDSTSDRPTSLAPGADDNASGTAAVLEIARVLAATPLDFSVKFIAFSAEEWGLYGSKHYAEEAAAAQQDIVAVINMDMIAYPDRHPWRFDVIGNEVSRGLADRYRANAAQYAGLTVNVLVFGSWPYSDHSPFWDHGYEALCVIENQDPENPNYHTTSDTLATLNLDYAVLAVKASLATVIDTARIVSTPAAPAGLTVRTQIVRSLYLKTKTVNLRWNAGADDVIGFHVYRAVKSGGPYELLTPAGLEATSYTDHGLDVGKTYYYVVTALDAQGRESRPSIEVSDKDGTWS